MLLSVVGVGLDTPPKAGFATGSAVGFDSPKIPFSWSRSSLTEVGFAGENKPPLETGCADAAKPNIGFADVVVSSFSLIPSVDFPAVAGGSGALGIGSGCAVFAPKEKIGPASTALGSVIPAAGVAGSVFVPKLNAGFDGVVLGCASLFVPAGADVEGVPKLKAGFDTGAGDAVEPANKPANGLGAGCSGSEEAGFSGDWLRCSLGAGCGVAAEEPNKEDAGFVSALFAPNPGNGVLVAADCCVWPKEKVVVG